MSYNSKNTGAQVEEAIEKALNSFQKTGGEINGDVSLNGILDIKVNKKEGDAGIKLRGEVDSSTGVVLTFNGYEDSGKTNSYRPILRDIGEPVSGFDAVNKKYMDEHIVLPSFYTVFLSDDWQVDTSPTTLDYELIIEDLRNPLRQHTLDVVWKSSRFHAPLVGIAEDNGGELKFIADFESEGVNRRVTLTLSQDNILSVTDVVVLERMGNKTDDIVSNGNSKVLYPSVYAVFSQFQRKPDIIYDDPVGFEAKNENTGKSWNLTGLDLSPYKRLKFYVKAGGDANSNYTPMHVVEMSLDSRMAGSLGFYSAGHASQNPNNENRLHLVNFVVNAEKTSIQFSQADSLYGTATTAAKEGRNCVLIEGYYD